MLEKETELIAKLNAAAGYKKYSVECSDVKTPLSESANELAKEFAEDIQKHILGEFKGKVLPDDKVTVDPEYLRNIKLKVETILTKMIEHYDLQDCISLKFRFRLDYDKLYSSKYHTLFSNKQDINGKYLKYGYGYMPDSFEDWVNTYLTDYCQTESIYMLMCSARRVRKDDLVFLNKMANK